MTPHEIFKYSAILVGLFLRSRDFPGEIFRRDCGKILQLLRTLPGSEKELEELLKSHGMWEAAVRLSTPGLLRWAISLLEDARVITCLQPGYPPRLLQIFGDAAPAVFWISGNPVIGASASVCGSRQPPSEFAAFAEGAGDAVARAGLVLVSGGAFGCDLFAERAALEAGGSVIRFLPHGIGLLPETHPNVCRLSLVDPLEPFSAVNAMERNLLIHCSSERVLVAHSRFREGGTWNGLQDALRRRATSFFMPAAPLQPWSRALSALGGTLISRPEEFVTAPLAPSPQFKLAI